MTSPEKQPPKDHSPEEVAVAVKQCQINLMDKVEESQLQKQNKKREREAANEKGLWARTKYKLNELKDVTVNATEKWSSPEENNTPSATADSFLETMQAMHIVLSNDLTVAQQNENNKPQQISYLKRAIRLNEWMTDSYNDYLKRKTETLERVSKFQEKGVITESDANSLKHTINTHYTHTFSGIETEYIGAFNSSMCSEETAENALENVISNLQVGMKTLGTVEQTLLENGVNHLKQHWAKSSKTASGLGLGERNFVESQISSIYSNQLNDAFDGVSMLALSFNVTHNDTVTLPSTENNETENSDTFWKNSDLSALSRKDIQKSITQQLEGIQGGGRAIGNSLKLFKNLSDPSIFSKQGTIQNIEDLYEGFKKENAPSIAEALALLKTEEAKQTVTEHFKKFTQSPTFRAYEHIISRITNPQDKIYELIQKPNLTPDEKAELNTFMDDFRKAQEAYIHEFGNLIDGLISKGINSEFITMLLGALAVLSITVPILVISWKVFIKRLWKLGEKIVGRYTRKTGVK